MPTPHASRRSGRQFRQKRLLLVLVAVIGTGLAAYAGHRVQVNRQAPALLERGRAASAEQSWKPAIDAYTQYLKLRPRDAAAHVERADAYAATRRYKDAVDGYLEGLAHEPERTDARRKLAELHHAARRGAAAREQLVKLIGPTGQTTDPALYLMLADCDLWDKKWERSEDGKTSGEKANLQAAVALPGAPASAFARLADRLRTNEKTPQAIAEADAVLDRLIDPRPTDLEARLLRAAYRKKYGDKAGARADLEFAYQSIPGANANPPLVAEYVALLRGEGELATAERVLRASHAAVPGDATLTLLLASVLYEANTPALRKEGQELVREVSAALPDGDRRLLALGDTLIDAGDTDAARAAAARLAKVPAHQPLAGYLTGRLALLAGDWPTARADLTAAIPSLPKTSPENGITARAHLALAQAHAAALDTAGQLASAHAALAVSPGWATAKLVAADALLRQDKRADAIDTLRTITTNSPAARGLLARIRLADALAQPDSPGRWREFDAAAGTPPYPHEVGLAVLHARLARGDTKAVPELEAELKTSPVSPDLWLALIGYLGDRDPATARATVDKAVAALGDRADLRLARATLLARDPKLLDPAAIGRLAIDADKKFSAGDRAMLLRGSAELLAGRGFRLEALSLLKDAAALHPFDLAVRLHLFDVANAANDADACAFALAEIRRLDTATGPTARVAEVTRELTTTPNPTAVQIAAWRTQLTAAVADRDSWARPHALLGDLAKLEKRSDAALAHYQAAMERGGSGDRVVQAAVELLMSQQNYGEAMRRMAQLDRTGGLSPALRNQFLLLRAASGEDAGPALQLVRSKEMADSDNYRDHLLRSFVFKLHGQRDEAKAALNKALARNATAPEAWEAKVRFLLDVSPADAALEVERAATVLRRAPADDADPLQVPLAIGHLREMVGHVEKAEAEYKAAADLDRADRRPVERLHDLYRRGRRGKDADTLLDSLAGKDGPVARWARRQLAFARLEQPDGFTKIAEAVALIDRNAADGGESLDDVRAKAVVQAFDPLQRTESLAVLAASLPRGPMTPGESLLYARLFLQAGQTEEAEKLLVAATSGGPRAAPVQLALLAGVQTNKGDTAAAKRTVDRLKLIDPFGWYTAVEAARLLAKTDKPAAAKVLLAHRAAEKPEERVYLIAPTLEGLGCPAEARGLLQEWCDTGTKKGRHILLAEFLIRQKDADAALDLAFEHAADVPAGHTARLLSGAVHCRHPDTLPAAERGAWRKRVDEVTKWLTALADAAPTDADLLFARAELADTRGAYDEAIQLYGQAADRTDNRVLKAGLRANRAWLMAVAQKNGGEEPLRLVNEAINTLGPMPALLDTRAAVKLAAGQPAEALADLDAAAAADSRPTFHFRRAVAYDRWKKPEARDAAVADAVKRGLTRDALHPLDWLDYDRLVRK